MVGDGVLLILKYFVFKGYDLFCMVYKIWVVTGLDFQCIVLILNPLYYYKKQLKIAQCVFPDGSVVLYHHYYTY